MNDGNNEYKQFKIRFHVPNPNWQPPEPSDHENIENL